MTVRARPACPATGPRPATLKPSIRSSPRAASAGAACSSAVMPAVGRSVTTPGPLYADGALDDPNVIVLGKLGQGKSALVKTLLWRMLLFGRRAFVLDIKREYGPLCAAVGVRPISLVPGGGVRLNPLASRPEEHAQLELLRAVTVTAIGAAINQVEAAALREALRVVRRRSRRAHAPPHRGGSVRPRGRHGRPSAHHPGAPGRRRPPRRACPPGPVRRPAAAACSTVRQVPGSTSTPGWSSSTSTPCATRRPWGS